MTASRLGHLEITTVQPGVRERDRQSEAAAGRARPRSLGLVEPVEDARVELHRQAGAAVADGHGHDPTAPGEVHLDRWCTVAKSVAHQVRDDHVDPPRISSEAQLVGSDQGDQVDQVEPSPDPQRFRHRGDEVDRLRPEIGRARIEAGDPSGPPRAAPDGPSR